MTHAPYLRSMPTLLNRATTRDDCQQTVQSLTRALSGKDAIIDTLAVDLRDANEALVEAEDALADALATKLDTADDREHWLERAVAAESLAALLAAEVRALRARPSTFAAVYALVAMGWQDWWWRFETEKSLAGEA